MIEALIGILIALLVLFVVFYIVKLAADYFGAPAPVIQIVGLIFLLIFLLYVFKSFNTGKWGLF